MSEQNAQIVKEARPTVAEMKRVRYQEDIDKMVQELYADGFVVRVETVPHTPLETGKFDLRTTVSHRRHPGGIYDPIPETKEA